MHLTSSRALIAAAAIVAGAILGHGFTHRYQIAQAADGAAFRLDRATGHVDVCLVLRGSADYHRRIASCNGLRD